VINVKLKHKKKERKKERKKEGRKERRKELNSPKSAKINLNILKVNNLLVKQTFIYHFNLLK